MTRALLRLARPAHLLLFALTYLLGVGVTRYLGRPQDLLSFWLGLGWTLLLAAASAWVLEYFRPLEQPLLVDETPIRREALRRVLFWAFTAALVLAFSTMIPLVLMQRLSVASAALLGLGLLLGMAYGAPPVRLADRGLGELAWALLLADVTPTLAFLLQSGDLHRLLPAMISPLTLLTLASLLALDLPSYAGDEKFDRRTLLLRLGWQRAVFVHHVLVAAAYLLYVAGSLLGIPLALLLPAFASLPVALLQIFWLNRIVAGARPIWPLVTATALALVGLTAYATALNLWVR